MRSVVMVLALVAGSTAAYGQQGTIQGSGAALTDVPTIEREQESATAQRNENGERRICRRIASSTSRMNRQQVCLTEREWRARQD